MKQGADISFSPRFPDAFVTFSAFRNKFPEVSGYCHCADSQGRELAETGKRTSGKPRGVGERHLPNPKA